MGFKKERSMDGQIYNRAVGRVAELQAELQRLEVFIATYRELAVDTGGQGMSLQAPARSIVESEEQDDSADEADRPKATPQAELERVVEQVLVANGAPLQRLDLMQRVKALGVIIGGRNEITNFGSKLSRARRLVNLPKLGYWPKELPNPSCSYEPIGKSLPAVA
jgi:hypothetical protein